MHCCCEAQSQKQRRPICHYLVKLTCSVTRLPPGSPETSWRTLRTTQLETDKDGNREQWKQGIAEQTIHFTGSRNCNAVVKMNDTPRCTRVNNVSAQFWVNAWNPWRILLVGFKLFNKIKQWDKEDKIFFLNSRNNKQTSKEIHATGELCTWGKGVTEGEQARTERWRAWCLLSLLDLLLNSCITDL